jgi:DNA-binding NarL/FixJ family response regulator
LLTQGLSNKQIARDLEISEITVKAHVSAIFRKIGVSNRTQAANAARRLLND